MTHKLSSLFNMLRLHGARTVYLATQRPELMSTLIVPNIEAHHVTLYSDEATSFREAVRILQEGVTLTQLVGNVHALELQIAHAWASGNKEFKYAQAQKRLAEDTVVIEVLVLYFDFLHKLNEDKNNAHRRR